MTAPAGRRPDDEGRYRMRGRISYTILGAHVLLVVVIYFLLVPKVAPGYLWAPGALIGLTLLLLVRYVSTTYTIDDEYLRAWKLLGGRRVPLVEIRRIEYASLRGLSPTGGWFGVGSWGWRGRLWSPAIGEFDSIYTDPVEGLLVTAEAYPLYLSPAHREAFARELSRRARSYTGPLAVDVGAPTGAQ